MAQSDLSPLAVVELDGQRLFIGRLAEAEDFAHKECLRIACEVYQDALLYGTASHTLPVLRVLGDPGDTP